MTPAATAPFATSSLSEAILSGLRLFQELPAASDSSFYNGQLGHVLLYAYAYKLTGEDEHWDLMMEALDGILSKIQSPATSHLLKQPGFLTNLCYLLRVLQRDDIVEVVLGEETLAQFDEIIFKQGLAYIRALNIDFLYGTAGVLHYLGTRAATRPQTATYLRELLEELGATRIEDARGVRFYNSHINHLNGNTDINMGLAHGHCGLLLVLLELHEAGLLPPATSALLGPMVTYLLALELPPEPEKDRVSYFPARHHEELPLHDPQNRQAYNNRMGWCYGDLNAVQVLYHAHRVLGWPELLATANRVGAHVCTRRSVHASGIDSSHLCHGSASLVLYYRRLYALHPLPCYRDAQAYWWQQTLAHLPTTYELAPTAFQTSGLLMGIPGVVLVLISEALDAPLAWPQLFLL